jgi:rubredoxin
MNGLVAAVRELERVRQQARALGIFTDDRELLECPACGLLEDVTSEGLLVTYLKDSGDMKDCGLRFSQVDETSFECPKCGTKVKAMIL